jgi:hypothetical protein
MVVSFQVGMPHTGGFNVAAHLLRGKVALVPLFLVPVCWRHGMCARIINPLVQVIGAIFSK